MRIVQSSTIHTARADTLRGLHYQEAPHREIKLVRCTRGSIFLVMVDLRADSATRNDWVGVELSAANGRMASSPRASRRATRRSRTTPRCSTRCPTSTCPSPHAECAGTTLPSDRVAGRREPADLGAGRGLAGPRLTAFRPPVLVTGRKRPDRQPPAARARPGRVDVVAVSRTARPDTGAVRWVACDLAEPGRSPTS